MIRPLLSGLNIQFQQPLIVSSEFLCRAWDLKHLLKLFKLVCVEYSSDALLHFCVGGEVTYIFI